MTRARVAAQRAAMPAPGCQMIRCTIATVTPLTVTLPGGGTVAAVQVPGATYTVGAAAVVFIQQPAVGPVFPI